MQDTENGSGKSGWNIGRGTKTISKISKTDKVKTLESICCITEQCLSTLGRESLFHDLSHITTRGQKRFKYRDRFSWFVINNDAREREIESILLQSLPFYVRIPNKQTAKFPGRIREPHKREHEQIPYIALPKLPPAKKLRR